MPKDETPPPSHPYPFSFEPDATLQLTDDGMELVREKDQNRIDHLYRKLGIYPVAVVEALESRRGPNNIVVMSQHDFEDTIGEMFFLSTHKLVEREIFPKEPIRLAETPPAPTTDDFSGSRSFYSFDPPVNPRIDRPITNNSNAQTTAENQQKRRWWRL